MVGDKKMVNKYTLEMKKALTNLWETMDNKKQRRYVAIIDSMNLQIHYLDQELQIAAGVDKVKKETSRIVKLH